MLVSVLVVQAIGTLVAIAFVLGTAEAVIDPTALAWAAAAGLGGLLGVSALYLALARGTMGVIAPLSGVTAAAIPVLVSVATGEAVHPATLLGMLLALVAVGAVALPAAEVMGPGRDSRGRERLAEWALAGMAGMGFAAYFLGVDRAHGDGAGTWWTLLVARGAGFVVIVAVFAALAAQRRPPTLAGARSAGPVLALSAVGDLGGNLFYVLALSRTTLAVAVVLSSLYPMFTAVLARVFLGEHLTRPAQAGVVLALTAVVLIGLGSTTG